MELSLRPGQRDCTFDGHRFPVTYVQEYALRLYLAAQARRGDALALALLSAMRMTIIDLDGKGYWPAA